MKYDVSVCRGRYVFQETICKRICYEWTTRPVQHTKSPLESVRTPIGVHLCSNTQNQRCVRTRSPADTAVSGLASFARNTLHAATTPSLQIWGKRKISWNPFRTSECRHYLLECKGRREVEILKIASIRFLFITHQATFFEVLSAAEWVVTSHSTAEPSFNHRIQISWFFPTC